MASSGWRELPLESIAEELTVGHVGPMASEYVDDGIPFLRSLNIEPLRLTQDDLKYITPAFHQRLDKSALKPGDVVIVRTGKPGACAVIPDWLPVANCSDLVIVRCGPELDPRFLAFYVNSVAIHHVAAHLVGAVQQHFNVGSARQLLVHLPPLSEQRSIAHNLGTLDDKIYLNRRMNETLEGIARALFKSWFVDFDPVRAKSEGRNTGLPQKIADLFPDSFQDSELGDIPSGWGVRSVYDCATFVNGLAFRTGSFSQGKLGLPVIKIGELKGGITSQTKFTCDEFEAKYRVRSGDVLFSWSGNPDTSIDTFLWTDVDGWLNQHIFKLQFHTPNQKVFVYYLLRSLKPVFIEIARNKQTTGLGHVTTEDMKRLRISWPSQDVLCAFDRMVAPLFNRVHSNSKLSRKLADLRATLLPKLISGDLRIPDAEKFIEARL